MATQKAISGNPQKNDGATFFNSNSVEYNDLRFNERGESQDRLLPISGYTQKAISAGDFANNSEGVTLGYTNLIAGQATSVARITSTKVKVKSGFRGYERIDVDAINALTGEVTYGANNGVRVLPSGLDGTTGIDADHTISVVPGELVYANGSLVPVQAEY